MTDPSPLRDRTPRRRWAPEEDSELRRRIAAREQPVEIAAAMGCPVDGVRWRAQGLRLRFAARINPWRESLPDKIEQLKRERAEAQNSKGIET